MLKKYKLRGVIHCFSGSLEMARKFIELGYVLGIGGVVTFSNSKLYQVIEKISLNDIVLETDSPYLAPTPFRGQKNSSKYIPLIAEKVAEILNISVAEVQSENKKTILKYFLMLNRTGKAMDKSQLDKVENMLNEID